MSVPGRADAGMTSVLTLFVIVSSPEAALNAAFIGCSVMGYDLRAGFIHDKRRRNKRLGQ
ncbi:hypothetical protein SAMN05216228_101113 [Rhizobium tibeticum]|uniref:Uncharacterized protein n=1 Tax=Rhizobium tibeticum TaxID=501024 RepID=A0A1H8LIH0_9HYPH|nr:hypothetical protein RTCCBAU85039_3026 [Rhizobium tibeticum]SEO05002.1 hypothetical protein SAMN05216228_101113 [Rhizobium tibeticum]